MKRLLCLVLCFMMLTALPARAADVGPEGEETTVKIEVIIGEQVFSATLADSETTRTMIGWLPMTLDMTELNGNEKYHYFDSELPTDARRPNNIEAGDLMLFGGSCLVLFYESFETSYSYTPVGRLDDPEGLREALGGGSVEVTFRLPEEEMP